MQNIFGWLEVFLQPKMMVIMGFGFASGLPLLLTKDTLQAWMTKDGINIETVVWFSLVSLPYSLKFLWSPLLDRFVPPFLGRRRGWILLVQIALMLAIALMASQSPKQSLELLAIMGVIVAFLSATQDIVVDAYRADILEEHEAGAGAGLAVLGYRIALLTTGAVAFALADVIGWQWAYLIMAGLMGIGVATTLYSKNPPAESPTTITLVDAVWKPLEEFFTRLTIKKGLFVLLFILLYRLADSLVAVVATPFLLSLKFTQTELGAVRGGIGLAATLVGTLAGGAVLSKIGVNKSLWIFGILQAASNGFYWLLAVVGQNFAMMLLTVNVENFCTGLGTAAFVGFLITMCHPQFSATQYALLSSLVALSRDIVVAPSGEIVEFLGWQGFFAMSILAAVPGLILLPLFAPWREEN
jgi:Major Facilitator Superfamily.